MKPFHVITVPHKDILEGRLTLDVFAASIWDVFMNRGPWEYRDSDLFFQKTFLTTGLKNLLDVVEKRLDGAGGDPVIQLKTPFGGGKTHTLITIFHKVKQWNARAVVIDCNAIDPFKNPLWGIIEEQLTGKNTIFDKKISPGKDALRALIANHQPLVILIDEVLNYAIKAMGIIVGESTLAAQTVAFLQDLSELVSALDKTCLVVTLPSSLLEHFDEKGERSFQQLQKVLGRVEKIYTPVEDHEIPNIIRARLFSTINETEINAAVSEIIEYFKNENLIPAGVEPSEYKKRFIASFPFIPEVIDTLYHRWGSFSTFQRTRGVLRFLALVIHSLKDANLPYMTLSHIDLSNNDIQRELTKHIGDEFSSVISADITSKGAGSKLVDKGLGQSYMGLGIATKCSTAVFLSSFSGGIEKGATITEIKRSVATISIPSSLVSEAVDLLKEKLFYLHQLGDKILFSNQPNINRMLVNRMENIEGKRAMEIVVEMLDQARKRGKYPGHVLPTRSDDVPDDGKMRFVILIDRDEALINTILTTKGSTPRVHRNVIFFIISDGSKFQQFFTSIKKKLAYKSITDDTTINLTSTQQGEIKGAIKKIDDDLPSLLRDAFRRILIPDKDKIDEIDMGTEISGAGKTLVDYAVQRLKSETKIIQNLAPSVLVHLYLSKNDMVSTKKIYENSLKTRGEYRFLDKDVIVNCITDGVKNGIFGIGIVDDDVPILKFWKSKPTVKLDDVEMLFSSKLSQELDEKAKMGDQPGESGLETKPAPSTVSQASRQGDSTGGKTRGEGAIVNPPVPEPGPASLEKMIEVNIDQFAIPNGKIIDIARILQYLDTKFKKIEIKVTASDGSITKDDYEMKVKEALRQIGIDDE